MDRRAAVGWGCPRRARAAVRSDFALRAAQAGRLQGGGAQRHFAKYVVARLLPLLVSFFFAMPSLRMRGISFGSIPSFERISSALIPSLCVFTRRTILFRPAWMSSSERRRSRPGLPLLGTERGSG